MDDMAPEVSASTASSRPRISLGSSGKLGVGSGIEFSSASVELRALALQSHTLAPEVLEAKRTALLEEKQQILREVVDRHDDLVCFLSEIFLRIAEVVCRYASYSTCSNLK